MKSCICLKRLRLHPTAICFEAGFFANAVVTESTPLKLGSNLIKLGVPF